MKAYAVRISYIYSDSSHDIGIFSDVEKARTGAEEYEYSYENAMYHEEDEEIKCAIIWNMPDYMNQIKKIKDYGTAESHNCYTIYEYEIDVAERYE